MPDLHPGPLARRETYRRLNHRSAVILLLLAALGLSIGLHGWKSRVPHWDILPSIWDAEALIRDGRIPVKGTLSSYIVHIPPGTTWLMVPGLLVSNDPRVFELPAAAALYILTLWGIYLLARRAFGTQAAWIAALLYAFSETGLYFATSLWPRGHPCFFVWMVYWLHRWVSEKVAWGLGISVVIWSAGMYVFMELAPAILLVPFFWYVYRPPVRMAVVMAATTISILIWLPYLSFQATRNFTDLRTLLAREPLYANSMPDGYRRTWCQPDLKLAGVDTSSQPIDLPAVIVSRGTAAAIASTASSVWYRWRVMVSNAAANFDLLPGIVGAKFVLLVGFAFALLGLGMSSTSLRSIVKRSLDGAERSVAWTLSAFFLLVAALLATSVLPRLLGPGRILQPSQQVSLWWLQVTLIGLAVIVLARSAIRTGLMKLAASVASHSTEFSGAPAFISAALAVPWAALLLITEPDRAERLMWLWPLQVIVLAGTVNSMSDEAKRNPAIRLFPVVLLALLVCDTAANAARVRRWARDGWSGVDSDEVRVVDLVARRLQGNTTAKIGYEIYFAEFMPAWHALDMRYRVGAEMDVLFAHRHRIVNADRCGEGIDVDDDYRIVDSESPGGWLRTRLDLPADTRFALIQEVGRFKVFERKRQSP